MKNAGQRLKKMKKLLLTDKVLDVLGFTEYWAGSGDYYGDRRLDLGGQVGDERLVSKGEYPLYYITVHDETPDPDSGYGSEPHYQSEHFTSKDYDDLYFLHDLYEDIVKRRTPEEVAKFIEITKRKGVNMYPYIQAYIERKPETSWEDYSNKLQRQIDALKSEYAKQGEDVKMYGDLNVKLKLKLIGQQNDLLYRFCQFLEKSGYIDSDWWAETPSPIDEFMASNPDVTQVPNRPNGIQNPDDKNNHNNDIH